MASTAGKLDTAANSKGPYVHMYMVHAYVRNPWADFQGVMLDPLSGGGDGDRGGDGDEGELCYQRMIDRTKTRLCDKRRAIVRRPPSDSSGSRSTVDG